MCEPTISHLEVVFYMVQSFLQATAWAMKPPAPYGPFHLIFTFFGVSTSILLARRLASKESRQTDLLLFLCSLILALTETYKQLFIYYIENNGHYDWWYFQFQLCSIPMYLGLGIPFVPSKLKNSFYSFIQDFGLLGGIMALAEPSGLMHPYWTMTVHGFLWHFNLIFMGLICAFYNLKTETPKSYLHTIPLFLFCTAIATAVNVLSHPYGNADMFYISPYYPNGQIVFHQISLVIGTFAGNCLYLASVLLGGFIIHISCLEIGQHYFTKISKF